MGSLCGSNTQTTSTASTTTPTNQAGLQSVFNQVQAAAQNPYTPYGGELTAPVNSQQTAGIAGVNANANTAQPYYNTAAGYAATSGAPLSQAAIQSYMNPYTQSVIDATQANFNESNGQQQQQVKGNAALSGALGGDRQAVAQAETARQQNLSQAPVIAGLQQANYQQAQAAAQADRSAAGNAAGTFGSLGTAAQTAGLQGAGAQINAGTLQQTTQQAADTAAQQQYLQKQAFPYQNAQFLAQYGTPAALAQGSSTNGTQTAPGPNQFAQLAGLGVSAAGLFLKDGGAVPAYADGGASPFNFITDTHGYVPVGGGAPQISMPQSQAPQFKTAAAPADPWAPVSAGLGKLKGSLSDVFTPSSGGYGATSTDASGVGGIGGLYERGGLVDAIHHIHKTIKRARGGAVSGSPFQTFADGGDVSDADRQRGTDALKRRMDANNRTRSPLWQGDAMQVERSRAADIEDDLQADRLGKRRDMNRRFLPGYADGGDTTFDDRFSAAYQSPSRGIDVPADDQPFRLAGPEAMDAWRKGVDQPNPAVMADADQPGPDGSATNPMAFAGKPAASPAVAAINRAAPQADPDAEPSSAMAYDAGNPMKITPTATDAAAPPEQHFGKSLFGVNLSDKTRQAIVAAGLGMMASKSPFALSAIGEGGLKGLSAYSEAGKAEQEAADKKITQAQNQKRVDMEAQRIAQSASQFAKTNSLAERQFKATQDKTPAGFRTTEDGKGYEPIPGGPADPEMIKKVTEAKHTNAPMPDETADFLAERVLSGDTKALIGLGRGAQGAENLAKIQGLVAAKAKERGMDASDVLAKAAEQSGVTASQRTFGTQTAKMAINATEAQGALELGKAASAAVPRTNWVPVNKAIQAYQNGTSDPALGRFAAANLAIINTYARAISPTGVPTVNDKEHAEKLLSTATSQERYLAILDQMNEEIKIAHAAAPKAKKELEDIRKGRTPESSASSGNKPATVTQNGHTYNLQPDGTYK